MKFGIKLHFSKQNTSFHVEGVALYVYNHFKMCSINYCLLGIV